MTSWPPGHSSSLSGLISLVQASHLIVLALTTGARDGELMEMPRDCLRHVGGQILAVGSTFKLSDEAAGEQRDWPLPQVAASAVRQQQRIAQIIDPGGKRLWATKDRRAEGHLKKSSDAIAAFCDRVLLPDGRSLKLLCKGNVHPHRFRKTAVRLASLSLVGANQILYDVLGHRDPEMTLNYILSAPDLQDEMREIAHEAAVALARNAITSANSNGGPAAESVRALVDRHMPRSAEKEMDVANLERAAEILSQNGRVMLVRPNVLCTKTFNQFGPCNRRAGNPDIGSCQVDCIHRLELEAAKADHRKAISQILERIPLEEGMMRVWWQAQLLSHLASFADLREESLADPRVRAALADVAEASIDMLDGRARLLAREVLEAAA